MIIPIIYHLTITIIISSQSIQLAQQTRPQLLRLRMDRVQLQRLAVVEVRFLEVVRLVVPDR